MKKSADIIQLRGSPLELILAQPTEVIEAALEALRCDWAFNARPYQLLPAGLWTYWLILAGRGWGKTRTGSEAMRQWVREGAKYPNLIGATVDDARDIMIEGESGILACCPKDERPLYKKSERKLVWPNGVTSLIFTADEPERLRGKQHEKLWADELGAWRYPESWDQAQFGLRLGRNPQAVVTTTPRPTQLVKELAADPNTIVTRGSTYDNQANLAPKFLQTIVAKYEGTRLGRQELHADILTDNPRALWKRSQVDALRITSAQLPRMKRIVVGVDPAVTNNETSDETGIVVVGLGEDNHGYVLDDRSLKDSVSAWGQAAVNAYRHFSADRVVAEVNNGGDLVEVVVRQADANVSYKAVRASRGKQTRAEPVSALYEQGRIHHVGAFATLEDQMCDYDPVTATKSPDRMDALVWGFTELFGILPGQGMLDYFAEQYTEHMRQVEPPRAQQIVVAAPTAFDRAKAMLG